MRRAGAALAVAAALAVLAGGCGGKGKGAAAGGGGAASGGSGSASDDDDLTIHPMGSHPTTELGRRQDAGCEAICAKSSACAVEDTRNDKAHPPTADELAQLDRTAAIDKRECVKKCEASAMSSRQVRVMEVCVKAESACEPFLACLDNLKPSADAP